MQYTPITVVRVYDVKDSQPYSQIESWLNVNYKRLSNVGS